MDIFEKIINDTTLSGVAPLKLDYVGIFDGYVEYPEAYRGEPSVFTTATGVISQATEKAEGTSVGAELSVRGIVHAIRLMQDLIENGRSTKFVSVKVCKALLAETELYESLTAILDEEGFSSPEKICLEFPSSVIEEDAAAVKRGLADVKAAGFLSAISSTDIKFPYAELADIKVDYVFLSPDTTAIAEDRSKTGVLTAIIALLHTMGVGVIAEGVRNDDEIHELTSVECFGFIPAKDYKGEFMLPLGARGKDEVLLDTEDGV